MVGVEIDMVVPDCITALELYERVFGVERVEATAYAKGLNEAVFKLYGTQFHLLDENPKYGLFAPQQGERQPMWLNLLVPDIKYVFGKAVQFGCTEIQPITEMAEMGLSNAIISDPFGYVWMLHQILREVSFEERLEILDEKMK